MNKKILVLVLVAVIIVGSVAGYALTGKSRDITKSVELTMETLGVDASNEQVREFLVNNYEQNYDALKGDSKSLYEALTSVESPDPVDYSDRELATATADQPVATIQLAGQAPMEFVLYPELAPESVNNFISLANSGFYDGLTMHRVVCNFMAQGGDPDGNGTGGPGYAIKGEFSSNGVDNPTKNNYGSIAMARSASMDSAGSQFYINTVDNSNLDGDYAVFGELISGRETLEYLNSDGVCNPSEGGPLVDITIESVSVDTKGETYPEPNKL